MTSFYTSLVVVGVAVTVLRGKGLFRLMGWRDGCRDRQLRWVAIVSLRPERKRAVVVVVAAPLLVSLRLLLRIERREERESFVVVIVVAAAAIKVVCAA